MSCAATRLRRVRRGNALGTRLGTAAAITTLAMCSSISTAFALDGPAPDDGFRPLTTEARAALAQAEHVAQVCRLIEREALGADLPPAFLVRLIWQESRFDAQAISPKGARGIAQFMPGTAKRRELDDPFDMPTAIRASAQYLAELLDEFGNLGLAAAAYNAGENRVRSFRSRKSRLPDETEGYVFSITGHTTDKWKSDTPPEADFSLDETLPPQETCRQLPLHRAPPQPRYAYAHNNQGVRYLKSGDYGRAIAHFDRAIQIRPRFPKAFYNRALAYRSRGEHERAIADYTQAIRLKANYAEAYNNRGVTHHRAGNFDLAVADYNRALRLRPTYVSALNNRAVAYRAKGDFVRAIADLTTAIAIDPTRVQSFVNRGLILTGLERRGEAIADLRRALQLRPNHRMALAGLNRLGVQP